MKLDENLIIVIIYYPILGRHTHSLEKSRCHFCVASEGVLRALVLQRRYRLVVVWADKRAIIVIKHNNHIAASSSPVVSRVRAEGAPRLLLC